MTRSPAPPAKKPPRPRWTPDLAGLEALLYRLITAPNGVDEGLAAETRLPPQGLEQLITGDDRLTARERLEIYANAYFFRLLEVFKEDYPALLAVIGDDNFHNLATSYLVDYPPTEPSVLYAGRKLPAFLRTYPLRDRWPFLADLATLERAMLDVFHAADASPLSTDAMRTIAPSAWPAMRLQLHPATRILDLEWPVDSILHAVEKHDPWHPPQSHPTTVLVWRNNSQVHYRRVERAEHDALRLLARGATFAAVCDAIAAHADADSAAMINMLLVRWLSDGVLTLPPS